MLNGSATRRRVGRGLLLAAVAAALSSTQTGCNAVQRRMTIRTNAPGAMVTVDDVPIGIAPASHNFTYYGQKKIQIVADGYETLTVMQDFPAPWYEIPPLDFISENFVPGQIRDHRELTFNLAPQAVTPPEQLLSKAEELRRGVHASTGTAPPSMRIGPPRTSPPGPSPGPEMIPTPAGAMGSQPMYPMSPQ